MFILSSVFFICIYSPIHGTDEGFFWQITDIHWDLKYNRHGDKMKMCHLSVPSAGNESLGYFGDYLCDSPYALASSAVKAMMDINPHPKFILWTGDNAPHTKDLDMEIIFKTIKNLTAEISGSFGPDSPLIPVLGNHDTHPKDEYPINNAKFYERYLTEGGWDKAIPADGLETFRKGGYYSFPVTKQIQVLVLNTNLYYRYNGIGQDVEDPAGQFQWLTDKLSAAEQSGTKAFVTAHAPPGFWERKAVVPFFNGSYNERFCSIVNQFSRAVIAQIYGHEHTDSFRVFTDHSGFMKSVAFLAPSVTPWFPSRLDGGTAINPSIRLYNFSSSAVLGYRQYHLNLTEANNGAQPEGTCDGSDAEECVASSQPDWKLFYDTKSAFGTDVLDADALNDVYHRLIRNDSFFQQYFLRNSAGIEHGYCNVSCKVYHICAIRYQLISKWTKCIEQLSGSPDFDQFLASISGEEEATIHRSLSPSIPGGMVIFSVIVVVIAVAGVFFMLTGRRRRMFFPAPNSASEFDYFFNASRGYTTLNTP